MITIANKTYSRANSLIENINLLSPLMKGPIVAAKYIIESRGKANASANAQYKGLEFEFRRCDLSAVKEILKTGEYEFLRDIISKKDKPYILDVGAHIGLFGLWSLSVNQNAIIKSIEASPRTYKLTADNAAKASAAGYNWSVQNRAAWKNDENVTFSDELESSMSHKVAENGTATVKGISFYEIINQLPDGQDIDIMKIDIEGAEEAFLCEHNVNFDRVHCLVIELHPNYCDAKKVEDLLKNNFSEIREMHDASLSKPLLFCRK